MTTTTATTIAYTSEATSQPSRHQRFEQLVSVYMNDLSKFVEDLLQPQRQTLVNFSEERLTTTTKQS